MEVSNLTSCSVLPAREPYARGEEVPASHSTNLYSPQVRPGTESPDFEQRDFDVAAYLREEHGKGLLRFSTAGSVDDGKSTLIGRLLYDTQSVYDDQVQSIMGKGTTASGVLDLALLTDGLRAEREQGITIDVAYRYFSTARRKFIIADTPGHEQYTRNMATGASTADVAIVLIDARKGLLPQSRRHAYITALLGVGHVVVAVNKMDLVGYSEDVFIEIQRSFNDFYRALDLDFRSPTQLYFIPVSALTGDNVVHASTAMPWYRGATLLSLLETIPAASTFAQETFRLSVQRVARPNLDFRGFAGQIAAGTIRPGDTVLAQPSGRTSRVARIVTYDGDLLEASAPMSVTLTLTDEIDISRGDLLSTPAAPAIVTSDFTASLVWMDLTPLDLTQRYLLKQATRTVQARIRRLLHRINLNELRLEDAFNLGLNSIGLVEIETLLPLPVDAYSANRFTGSFVLIDQQTNATVGAGMIRSARAYATNGEMVSPISPGQRIGRYKHPGTHLHLRGPAMLAYAVESTLFHLGANVTIAHENAVPFLVEAGLLVITHADADTFTVVVAGRQFQLPGDDINFAVQATLDALRTANLLL